jgi:hypothetical protein
MLWWPLIFSVAGGPLSNEFVLDRARGQAHFVTIDVDSLLNSYGGGGGGASSRNRPPRVGSACAS